MKNANEFNWDITKTPVHGPDGEIITGYHEIKRDDNNKHIIIKPNTFHPMTTAQFSDVAHQVAAQVGGSNLEFTDWDTTDRGKNIGKAKPVITCQMEISEPLEIAGSKIVGKLTIGVGFDGQRSFFIGHTNRYLRCTNAFSSIVKDFTSRLTKNNMVRIEDIIKNIGLYKTYEEELYSNFQKFQNVKISEGLVQECVARLIDLSEEERAMSPKELQDALSTQKLNKKDEILASVRSEMAELGNNAWGLFNGVTHYTTHVMSNRGSNDEMSTMFGAKNTANQTAYEMCVELIED
jgi:Domain of unknown function (DUF932)